MKVQTVITIFGMLLSVYVKSTPQHPDGKSLLKELVTLALNSNHMEKGKANTLLTIQATNNTGVRLSFPIPHG